MEYAYYLFAANAAAWAGLAGYLFFLARKQAWLEQRLRHLEAMEHEHHDNDAT
ncbi:MAG TPA: CcmD family protein [Desulfonatronum sp.]|nr:CcmD family protein [Desulfonatronum sp.]